MSKLILLALIFALPLRADLREPYSLIHDLPFDDHGWFGNAAPLTELIVAKNPLLVIEVGSWLGCSTRFLAESIDPNGHVYAVDTWRGSSEHQKDPRLSDLYQIFLSNVKHAGLTEKITPVRMESLEAARALNLQADLIYIDAAHDTKSAYNDIIAWNKHLTDGGVLCGDDWSWGSVRLAVQKAAKELHYTVHTSGNFWWYE
jgi:predicted O-methyltransferase YrrM